MARTAIYVHRFMTSNGVGNAAISLFEDLTNSGYLVDVYCMRSDPIYKSFKNVHHSRLKLPYSMEVFLLSIWSSLTTFRFDVVHSFEVFTPFSNYFHLHFDISIRKSDLNGWNPRKIARSIAGLLTRSGLRFAIHKNSVIIVPSYLLARNLRNVYRDNKFELIILPNRLSNFDLDLLNVPIEKKLFKDIYIKPKWQITKPFLGLIANGDFFYKGLDRIEDILEFVPENFTLLIIGGSKPPINESDYSEKVTWLPSMDRETLFCSYKELSGVFVASPFESFSMVALEAISTGTPVFFLGEAGIYDFYKDFVMHSNFENLVFTPEFKRDWLLCIAKKKSPQPEFNQFLIELRAQSLLQLVSKGQV